MRVLGMMSGTSADGIDVALTRIEGAPPEISFTFEGHYHVPFEKHRRHLRQAILRLANGAPATAAEVSDLNFRVGEEFAEAAIAACRQWKVPLQEISLIGSHGQTIFHQGAAAHTAQRKLRHESTLQIGEPSIIAERTGIRTIADFRPADMAAGGGGAPLVPFADYLLFRDARIGRAALNIGGVSNVTVIPAGAPPDDVFAFDTGPGNMIVDALIDYITRGRRHYDRNARTALAGRTIPELLARLMREKYLRKKPPKTAGREQFGEAYTKRLIDWARTHHAKPPDMVRTLTVFTALSIADAFRRFVLPRAQVSQLITAGGGTLNPLMMAQLAAALPGIEVISSSRFGIPAEAREAVAFAVLAYEAYHGRTNNLPSATGARHAVVMGKSVDTRSAVRVQPATAAQG